MGGLLRFDGVKLDRGGRTLFEGLSFELGPGAGLLVTGPNGVGKSSLIRLAAGLLAETAGEVRRTTLALADDHLALDRELPLGNALAFWAAEAGLQPMGLEPIAEVPVRMLSTGQAKRAMLARVAASRCPVWLLDEPLNGLDDDGAGRLNALIAAHRRAGGAVLAASHRPLAGEWTELRLGG